MEDVIFSGSGNRPSRNMAEVTLVRRAREGRGSGPEPLEIARRIEREPGSTYRINGREVRARDVQILFADAATGAHSSALVRQGQVAELIAAKPEQRRGILEDAAGISGLHARRNEAEQKLQAAEQNLERLDDVMDEIGAGWRSCAARRARRSAIESSPARSARLEAIALLINWENAARAPRGGGGRVRRGEGRLRRLPRARRARRAKRDGGRRPRCRRSARSQPRPLRRLTAHEGRRRGARSRGGAAQGTPAGADRAARAGGSRPAARDRRSASDADAAAARLDEEEATLRRESAAVGGPDRRSARCGRGRGRAVTAREAEFAAAAGALAAAGAERAARERAMREAQAKLRRLEEERARCSCATAIASRRSMAATRPAAMRRRRSPTPRLCSPRARRRRRPPNRRLPRRARRSAARARPMRRPSAISARCRPKRARLPSCSTWRRPSGSRRSSIRSQSSPGYENALAAALGDDLDASLDPGAPAFWGAERLRTSSIRSLPEGAEPLSGFVQGPGEPDAPAPPDRRGRGDEAATALAAEALAPGQRLVTRDGGLWRWDGLSVQPGSATARRAPAGAARPPGARAGRS